MFGAAVLEMDANLAFSAVVGKDCAEAIAAANAAPAGIATLILPSDTAWGEDGKVATVRRVRKRRFRLPKISNAPSRC